MKKIIPTRTIVTRHNEICLDEEGILRVRAFEGADIDMEELLTCFDAYRELGCDKKKVLQLLDLRVNVSITHEAREYVSLHGKDFFIASAIITESLAVRLITNFFIAFYKQFVPLKLFATEKEALKWLRTFKN